MSLCASLAIYALVGLTSVPLAEAEIISVTVNTTRDYENARHYTYAEITIHGSVARADGSVGQYTVPAIVIYVLAAVSLAQWHYITDADAAAIIVAARNEPLSDALRRDPDTP
jgi:hypothetical protein